MKRPLLIITLIILAVAPVHGQTITTTTAHRVIETESTLTGITTDYSTLNKILEKTTKDIAPIFFEKDELNKRTATKILGAIHKVLMNEGFEYRSTDLLISALTYDEQNKHYYSDCDTNSYIYYSILFDLLKQDVVLVSRWGHMYVRWDLPNNKHINWETTTGTTMADQEYSYLFNSRFYNELANPDQVISSVYYTSGVVNDQKGQYQKAISDLDKAIELGPIYPDYYNERGLAKYKLGNCKEAIADYSEAIRLNPKEPAYYGNRAVCYYKQNDYKKAYDDFGSAINLGSNNDYYYEARSTLRKNMRSLSFAENE